MRRAHAGLLGLHCRLARRCAGDAARAGIPAPRGMVNDFAECHPAGAGRAHRGPRQRRAREVRRRDRRRHAADLGGRDVSDITLRIGREWKVGANAKIGDAKRNAGVVILVVPKETSADGTRPRRDSKRPGQRGLPHRRGDRRHRARGDAAHAAARLRRRDRVDDAARCAAFRVDVQLHPRLRRARRLPRSAARRDVLNAGRRIPSAARLLHFRAPRAPPFARPRKRMPLAGARERRRRRWMGRWRRRVRQRRRRRDSAGSAGAEVSLAAAQAGAGNPWQR